MPNYLFCGMKDLGLHLAYYFFHAFHTALIFFNLLGWLHSRTQKLNLISLLVTFGSWSILGIWKGWGYCFLTEWHYRILRTMREGEMPSSYIVFLIEKIAEWSPNAELVGVFTVGLSVLALVCSIWVNLRKKNEKRCELQSARQWVRLLVL